MDLDYDDNDSTVSRGGILMGKQRKYEVLRKMEFTSDRKRMSVLLRDPLDNKLKLYVKGADSIIKERLDNSQLDPTFEDNIENFLNIASK